MHQYHSNSLRQNRSSIGGYSYHLTFTTLGRRTVFADFNSAAFAANIINSFNYSGSQTLAYVVMPDHIHWLLALGEGADLSKCVKSVKGRIARGVNKLMGGQGSIWQPGFHDHMIRVEEDLHTVARYIVANPLRADLVNKIGDYPFWSAVYL